MGLFHSVARFAAAAATMLGGFPFGPFALIDARLRGYGPGRRGVDSLHRAARRHHRPHQNQRECARRLKQVAAGEITFHDITPTGTEKGKSFARAPLRRAKLGRA